MLKNYSGKVYKTKDINHTERLDIYLEGEWRPICTKELTKLAADSACRQIGFTQSTKVLNYSTQVNLLSSTCIYTCISMYVHVNAHSYLMRIF